MDRLINAIGINGIGAKTAKILSNRFGSLSNLINANYDDLISIPDIGPILAQSILDYFKDEEKMNEVNNLIKIGVNTISKIEKVESDDRVNNKKFVITGSFDFISRDKIKEEIEKKGGNTSGSVSSKTDVVIVGADPGKKYDDAVRLGITIWREKELKEFLYE